MLGSRLSHYDVTAKLGEGGMGEVYRATDSRLGRDVALKILPEAFVASPERVARFEREARVLASLAHPNIAAVYDVGQVDGVHYLAMELAEGETLQARLAAGVPSRQETLSIGRQVAEALEAAHGKGIVHRDLKPANIVLDGDGRVKLLDFGLAKALAGDSGDSEPSISRSPTMTAQPTAAGVILGTAAYMSPEQARGKAVDARTDVWAFGLILWELLTGESPFRGDTVTDTLAAVLRADLDWSALPPETPAALRNLVRRCLERDPARRMHAIADARIVLQEVADAGDAAWVREQPASPAGNRLVPWVAGFALGAVAALAAVALVPGLGGSAAAPASGGTRAGEFRALTLLPGGEGDAELSPDGQSFAYVKSVNGQSDIFVQRVDGRNAINVTSGCERDDSEPAFSGDGRRIAYRSECGGGGIFVMGSTGESARRVTDFGYSPAWSPGGDELAVVTEQPWVPTGRTTQSTLWAINVESGERRLVSEHDAMHPAWSPDGQRLAFWGLPAGSSRRDLFTVAADGSRSGAADAAAVTDDPPLDWAPVWTDRGRSLIFSSTRGGTMNLWKIPVDPAGGGAAGPPAPLPVPSSWAGWPSVSSDGRVLTFVDRNARETVFRVAVDRSGALAGSPEPFPLGSLETAGGLMDIAADGRSLVFASAGLPQHLFIVTTDGDVRQLTEGFHRDRQPALSPDGTWIAFQSDRYTEGTLAVIRADGGGLRRLEAVEGSVWNPCWRSDGRMLAYTGRQGGHVVAMDGDVAGAVEKLPEPGDGLNFDPRSFSPDGRLLAGILSSPAGAVGMAVLEPGTKTYRHRIDTPATNNATLAFAADGRHLIYAARSRLVRHDLQSGEEQVLFSTHPDRIIPSLAVSPDRRWMVYMVAADESDVWLGSLQD